MADSVTTPAHQSHKQAADSYKIEYQPQLVEETVLRAIAGHKDERRFRCERDAIYALQDDEAREQAFQTLHQSWFERLALSEPLRQVLAYWPILHECTSRCLVLKAPTKKERGAELFVAPEEAEQGGREVKSVVVQLTPELMLKSDHLLDFLRRELLHVVDMLDPGFGYTPHLPKSKIGPTYDRLLQERYRILWALSIDGRLRQKGFLPLHVKEQQWTTFANTFQGNVHELKSAFNYFFAHAAPKHQELLAFCRSPENWLDGPSAASRAKGMCPLCHFPSYHLMDAATLSSDIRHKIAMAHPHWHVGQRICPQCADLYELRGLEPASAKSDDLDHQICAHGTYRLPDLPTK